MKLSTTVAIVCMAILLISCASMKTPRSPFWDVDIDSFKDYVAQKEVADIEGIWDIGGYYTIGLLREGSGYIGFILDSVHDNWLPRMVKFKVETVDDSIRTIWYMLDHSIQIYEPIIWSYEMIFDRSLKISTHEPILLTDNLLIVGSSQLKRLDSKFPDTLIDLSADAEHIVNVVEEIHPIFIMEGMLEDDYSERRYEYLETTKSLSSIEEFQFATERYLVSLKDAHTSIIGNLPGGYVDAEFFYHDRVLYILDEQISPEQIEVLEIGGISVASLLDVIDKHFYFENEAAKRLYYPFYARHEVILELAGIEIPESMSIPITLSKDGEKTTKELMMTDTPTDKEQPDYIIRYEMIDDIFYIKLTEFEDGDHITPVVEEVEKAVENGIWRFIFDLRDNTGGNIYVTLRFLEAWGITGSEFSHGGILRLSDTVREFHGNYGMVYDEGDSVIREPNPEMDNPNNMFISVLTNGRSMSSAMITAGIVQDGRLGNVIGEPSGNAPNSFMEIVPAPPTPILNQTIWISTSWVMRADVKGDPNTLMPDILVPAEDALDTALEYLRGLERE